MHSPLSRPGSTVGFRTRPLIFSVLVPAVILLASPAYGQSPDDLQDLNSAPFLALQQERDKVTELINNKVNSLAVITNTMEWRKTEGQRKQDLENAKRRNEPKDKIDKLQRDLDDATSNAGYPQTDAELKKASDTANAELAGLKKRKADIEHMMNSRADVDVPKQDFRKSMSIAFTVLVGLVILGFYVLAYLDEGLRREMFSRQSGIQFITLFSLVIAIILFGITGILESRELSALLGVLSGYILGRSTGGSPASRTKDQAVAK